MIRSTGRIAAAVAVMGVLVDPASAQLAGNPVYAINPGVGVTLNADFGGGVNDESGQPNYFGGRVVLGIPMASAWVGGGLLDDRDPTTDNEATLGGGVAFNIIKAPMLPVALSLQAGGATVGCGTDCSYLDLVAGPSIKVNVPTAGIGIEPWLMPRVHLRRLTFLGVSVTQTGFGASGGVNVDLPMGFGIHAVVDFADFATERSGALSLHGASPLTAGIGLHYKITVPSLGLPLLPVVN
jgi:hypothetical protein